MNHLITITKNDGTKQLFEEDKLAQSLKRVGADPQVIDEIIDHVEREMWNGMPTDEIYRQAFTLLRKRSKKVAVKYSVRRALGELGPDGFPFERFVARVFNVWGYETVTDQIIMGRCVEHEMDVVAWKGDELAMVEAKFHNEFGMKSDLKVALYVEARFEDLSENMYEYGGKKRKLKDRYLFTNTKFSDRAITYGTCRGLKLVGWNYPLHGSLHEIIDTHKLHPITCSTKLSKAQKRDLVGRGHVLCTDIIRDPHLLALIGITGDYAKDIIDDAKMIIGEM